jgi:hypothetical protein
VISGGESLFGLKFGTALINAYRALRNRLPKRRPKLIFAEKAQSSWGVGEDGTRRVVHLRALLSVTHDSRQDGVLVVRVEVRQGAFALWRRPQDCNFCDIGGERVGLVSPLIPPRTATTMQIAHPFLVEALPHPRTRVLSFWIAATDQFDYRHSKRVRSRKFPP